MKNKLLNKLIAGLIIIILTVSDWGLLVSGVYAAYEELEVQKSQTNNKNVEFDTYFKTDDKIHSLTVLKSEEGKLYIKLNVKNGYLKQGKISFDNPNFIVSGNNVENAVIDGNTIQLEQISGEKEIEIPFYFEKQEQISLDYFNKDTNVNLQAIYIDEKGKEREISGSIKIHLNWTENAQAKVEQQIEKVIDLGSGRTLVQVGIKDYIENNSVPAENTKLEIEALKINNTEIESIDVYATKTIQANGIEDGTGFIKDNWSYDKENGKIVINVANIKTADNKISWKNGEDEFKVIYILKSLESIANKQVALNVTGEIEYNGNKIAFEEKKDASLIMSGSLINSEMILQESINKGYMYASSEETIYTSKITSEISYNEMVEYLDIKINEDKLIYADGNIAGENKTILKSININKTNFENLFGTEGKIEVYGNGNKITEINKDSQVNQSGNIEIIFENEVNNVQIKTSKPIVEGKLEINTVKAVKSQLGYNTETIKAIKQIKSNVEIRTNITEEIKEGIINLNETVTKAELVMLTDRLSTVVKNENVEIRVLFRTDSNMYDLYQDPNIEIELPVQIKEVKLNSIEAAFGEGFALRNYEIVQNSEGKQIIKIGLNGKQTKHAIDISEGMSLTIKADMTIDKKTASSVEKVKLRYTNENAIGYDNNGVAEGEVKIEAPTGVVAINSVSNYNVEGETATSLSSKEQTGELEILTDKKLATMTIDVINNYEKEIENPSIIGRVPYVGNKKVTGEELGSTFTAAVVRGIEKQTGLENANYKVYYSSNGEATEDIANVENGWKESIAEVEEVKSYLIQAEGYKMQVGDVMSFNYEVEIPEGLNHNESAYGTYAVNYEIQEEGGIREEQIIAPTVGTTTGPGPELEVSLEANVGNESEVQEGQIIKYNVNIKNIGEVDAKNVKVTAGIPEKAVYVVKEPEEDGYCIELYNELSAVKEYTETIENIQAGQTYTATYEVKAGEYEEANEDMEVNNNIIANAKISADDLGKELQTATLTNKIVKETVQLELTSTFGENIILKQDDQIKFSGRVINDTSEDKENVVVTYNVPNGLEIERLELTKGTEDLSDKVSRDNDTIKFDIGTLEANSVALIVIRARVKAFENNEYDRTMISKLETDGRTSNELTNYASAPKVTANQTSNKDKYINAGSEVEYYIEIANSGKVQARNVKIKDILPEELKLKEIKVVIGNEAERSYSSKEIKIDIPAGTTAKVTIVANILKNAENNKEVTNKVEISGDHISSFEVNSITHTISSNKEVETEDGQKIDTYSIAGTAWEDKNKDGRKDQGESKLANIEVLLVDNNTGNIAKKVTSNNEQRTKTNTNGEYKFDEVIAGEYIVVFLYDSGNYTITEYKKAGILESENSDAVKAEIKLDGTNKTAGVTELLKLTNNSISGVDIGLMKMEPAVFGIDKVVTKIVMQNTKTSKTANFDNSKLAKMDVDGKYIDSTNLVMEYKIKVTNEGNVAGYVRKIVDHVPSQFKFSTDLNKDWYLGSNGEVYNTSLANTLINPGETKEVTLVLTKKTTESDSGIVNNTAEIVEIYNEYGAQNIINNDTTRIAADIIIGIKTGREITYISLLFTILGFLGMGIYFINNRVFNKVIDKKLKYLNED